MNDAKKQRSRGRFKTILRAVLYSRSVGVMIPELAHSSGSINTRRVDYPNTAGVDLGRACLSPRFCLLAWWSLLLPDGMAKSLSPTLGVDTKSTSVRLNLTVGW